MADADFETVAWVYGQSELFMLLSLLEDEDVFVLPIARGHISVEWYLTIALGGVEIRVHAADAARARARLAKVEPIFHWRGFFFKDRLNDILLMLILFSLGVLAAPVRLPAYFVLNRPGIARRDG